MVRKIPNLDNIIIEHRGYHDDKAYPENSLKAFACSKKSGHAIELDVQLTTDGKLMVFHDENLKRMTGFDAKIQEVDYQILQKLHLLETSEKIPLFEDVLELISGKIMIDIEIKPTKRIDATCRELLRTLADYPHNYLVKSFDPRIVLWLRRHAANLPRGMLITECVGKGRFIDWLIKSRLVLWLCRPDFVALHKTLFVKKRWQKMVGKRPILLWTINSEAEIKRCKNVGYICNIPFTK